MLDIVYVLEEIKDLRDRVRRMEQELQISPNYDDLRKEYLKTKGGKVND